MKIDEVRKILSELRQIYPARFSKMTANESQIILTVWGRNLEPYTYDDARSAVDAFISSDRKGYCPELPDIIRLLPHRHSEQRDSTNSAISPLAMQILREQNGGRGRLDISLWQLMLERDANEGDEWAAAELKKVRRIEN